MPLPVAHGLVGAALIALIHPKAGIKHWKPLALGFIAANLPDFDFLFSFLFGWRNFHRGFTHSILCAVMVAAIVFVIFRKQNWLIPISYSAAFLSHALMDFAAGKTGGVRLFYPFSGDSYRLGLLSFSELTRGFRVEDLVYFTLTEILIFTPIFVFCLFVIERKRGSEIKRRR